MNSPANIEEYVRRATAMRNEPAPGSEHALTRTLRQGTAQGPIAHAGARATTAPDDVFRGMRTRLLALAGARNFVTLVVAVSPRSGGSFVARNLAEAFAFDASRSVLLMDCNLHHPAQQAALGVDGAHGGLIDYLEHAGSTPQQIQYRTRVPRLSLIPAGTPRAASAELLSAPRMRGLVDGLRAQSADRYLILDGPALNGSPDALLLSELADYVVIVAAFGRDTAAAINQAVAGLDPKKVAGVTFNYPP